MASIVVHGGFLTYVVAYARLPGQPLPRPRLSEIKVELIAEKPFTALRRGDREDVLPDVSPDMPSPEANLDDAPPQQHSNRGSGIREEADSRPTALANEASEPLPEDGGRKAMLLPLPERRSNDRVGANPPAKEMLPISTPRAWAQGGMFLPARRMSLIPREEKLSERGVADPRVESVLATLNVMPPPPVKAPAIPTLAAGAEPDRAAVLDMGAQGSLVVAVLPKEAGTAMFAARIVEPGPLLPEDRSTSPGPAPPEETQESQPVPPPVKRTARLALARKAGQANPDHADGKSARTAELAKKARVFEANVRTHLAAHKPGGGYGPGRVVVAFNLSAGGGVRSARIVQSSGRPPLDQSVLHAVFGSDPFPKPPEGLSPAQLRFVIPFEFR